MGMVLTRVTTHGFGSVRPSRIPAIVRCLPVDTSWIIVGAKDASVHMAQTRVLLQVQLLGSGAASAINLPIYVEVASGTAALDALEYGYPDISTSFVSSLLGSLLGNLDLKVSILGLGLDLGPLLQLIGNILAAVTAPLDQLLASVLQTLGVSLGQANVWATGIRCDNAVLVY